MKQFPIDDRITDWVVSSRHEPFTSAAHLLSSLGDTLTLTLVAVAVFVAAWLANRVDLAVTLVIGSVSGYILLLALKLLFNRPRPPLDDRLIDVAHASFPSGHAMLSTIVYGLSAVVLYRVYPAVRERALLLLWIPAMIVVVGASRVYLGVHWFSDIIAGWAFGGVWLVLCMIGHTQIVRRPALARLSLHDIGVSRRRSEPRDETDQDASRPS